MRGCLVGDDRQTNLLSEPIRTASPEASRVVRSIGTDMGKRVRLKAAGTEGRMTVEIAEY